MENGQNNKGKEGQGSDATKTTYTYVVDVTDIVEPEGGMGFKSGQRMEERDLSQCLTKKQSNRYSK